MLVLIPIFIGILSASGLFAYSGGNGTVDSPYEIANLTDLEDLQNTSGDWGAYFIQTADIDASTTSGWNGGAGFDPIGNSSPKFTGSYDGQDHTIDGLTINRGSTYYIGLFGYTYGATIENLGLTNVDYYRCWLDWWSRGTGFVINNRRQLLHHRNGYWKC